NIVAAGIDSELCPGGDIYGLCYHMGLARFVGGPAPCASDADCPACESCGAAGACGVGPRPTWTRAAPRGAMLTIAEPFDQPAHDGVTLKWTGATPLGFDPTTADDIGLCLYLGGHRAFRAIAPAGGTCRGKPCWRGAPGVGFRYRDQDGTPDGILKASI